MKKHWFAAGLLLAIAGCGDLGAGDGGEGVAAVQPSLVSPEDLRAAATDPRVVAFYEARQWAPVWNADLSSRLVEAINGANRHALDPDMFLGPVGAAEAPAAREAALTLAALSYGDALARGRVDPGKLWEVYEIPRPQVELAAGLNQAIEAGDVGAWLEGLAPQDPEYKLLSQAYVTASREAGVAPKPIDTDGSIRPGEPDPRLDSLVQALRAAGYVPVPEGKEAAPAPSSLSPELVEAVRRFQSDHGLEPDGVVGKEVLDLLNGGLFERARTLAVNLERRRWLPRQAAPTRIDVNVAASELAYWRDGGIADQRRVVTGQPGNETPQLQSPMFRLVANPSWTVPKSIEEEEIAPKGEGYLQRNNMVRRDGWIVQLPGPKNSLGQVKFDMKNDHAIYLHDTPAKNLFERDRRHFSHGCVRVQDALGFARMIAQQEGVLDEWERARPTGEETFIALPREIPVRLLYHTAFARDGRLQFRPDAYQWDEDVAEALGLASRPRRERPTHVQGDIGP